VVACVGLRVRTDAPGVLAAPARSVRAFDLGFCEAPPLAGKNVTKSRSRGV